MPELERLRADHASAVLAFELVNRTFFATTISERGDAYFADFAARHRDMLAGQDAGSGAFYLLVDDDSSVLGRFNLVFGDARSAELGYRVAERACGRGVATSTVRSMCLLAATEHGLLRLRAATSHGNAASRRVLEKAGFVAVGPAGPADLGGKHGTWFERDLTAGAAAVAS